jgi:hypothetical protein
VERRGAVQNIQESRHYLACPPLLVLKICQLDSPLTVPTLLSAKVAQVTGIIYSLLTVHVLTYKIEVKGKVYVNMSLCLIRTKRLRGIGEWRSHSMHS